MNLKKDIFKILAMTSLILGFQSCQDMDDNPPFDYPPSSGSTVTKPILYIPFENNVNNLGSLAFKPKAFNLEYVDGIVGKAYKGSANTYVQADLDGALRDTIANIGSFTVSMWINTPQVTMASSIFSITHTTGFWSNIDFYLEGEDTKNHPGQLQIKGYMRNETKDKWITDIFLDKNATNNWTHLVFRYNGDSSQFDVYVNGATFATKDFAGFGKLKFNDVGPIVIGSFPFDTEPSLTTGGSQQAWAGKYKGLIDQFRLFNKVLTDQEIKILSTENIK